MTKYNIEEKDSFTVLGVGTNLKSDYTDSLGIDREKSEFWKTVSQDGTLEKLKAIATNDYIFASGGIKVLIINYFIKSLNLTY